MNNMIVPMFIPMPTSNAPMGLMTGFILDEKPKLYIANVLFFTYWIGYGIAKILTIRVSK